MSVNDNGVGFSTQEAEKYSGTKGSLGLMSMQERAKLIGAKLTIDSEPGKGTTIRVST